MDSESSECCPRFDPEPWDEKSFVWKDKRFIRDRVTTFLFIPINFGSVIKRMNEKVQAAGADIPDWLCLSDHTSRWKMDLYLAVDREIPGAENVTLSGSYISRVYEGDFRETGNWGEDFRKYADRIGFLVEKLYMWYTTCPKCARKYGKNYVVFIAGGTNSSSDDS